MVPSKTTQETPRIHATGQNVRIINSRTDAIHYNSFSSTPSSSTTSISTSGSGVHVPNAGNQMIFSNDQDPVIYINNVRMSPAGPTRSSTRAENVNNYQEGMQALQSALERIRAGRGNLRIVDTGDQYIIRSGEDSIIQNGTVTVIRNGRDTLSFSGLPIVRL